MPKIKFLPHETICPKGKTVEAEEGASICAVALANGISIDHACEMSCACTTCHVIVTKGYDSMEMPGELEEDLLDRAWGLTPESRLSCQACVGKTDIEVEIPKYSINQVSESH